MERFRIVGNNWRGKLLFSLFFFLTTYWASFFSGVIHEVGHGLVALIVGQNFYGFVATLTGGFALVTLGEVSSTNAMISAAGIVSQFLFGLAIFLVSFKLKGFTSKIVLLTFASTSMINPGSYLLMGSIMKEGDPFLTSSYVNVSLEALAFLGCVLLVFVGSIAFPQFVKVLQDFLMFKSKRDSYVSVVFIFISGSFLNFLLITLVGASLYSMVAFLLVALLVSAFSAFAVKRYKLPDVSVIQQKFVSWRGIGTNLLLAIVCTTVWLGAFGYTLQTAHGLIWYEFGPVGVANVKVTVNYRFLARIEMRFRPYFSVSVSEKLWLGVKNTPNWKMYEQQAMLFAKNMFNTASFELVATKTDDADIWYLGKWHGGGARVVVIDLNLNKSINMQRLYGIYGLTVYDPWVPIGYLDSFNFTCNGLKMIDYACGPRGSSNIAAGGLNEGYLLWLNETPEEAPDVLFFMFVKD